jgi:formylmethanofuran dehydrogenase subunit A
VHIHCNNLGHTGNFETTLETMRTAEGRRMHVTHIQFHSYGSVAGKATDNPTSRAADISEYVNTHPNITADVGAVLFGRSTSMTADAPLAYMLRRFGGHKWINADTEHESGCGIVPFTYQDKVYTNALQWAIGLELFLRAADPWRMVFSTDHPNGGTFMNYPHLIRLLMDREFRKAEMAKVNQQAIDHSGLRECDSRELSLYEIAIITRAGPARILGLTSKGHLGVGADADVTIYEEHADKERMFEAPKYVIKTGDVVVEDHEFRGDFEGKFLHVAPDYDPAIEKVLEPFFDDYYTIQFRNYPVDASYVAHRTIVPTALQAAGER